MMRYKGYVGVAEVDDEAGIVFGRVAGLRDVITFQGKSVAEAIQSFHNSVDFYLEVCAKQGTRPEKPFSGKILLRLQPGLHRALAALAEHKKTSINALAETVLSEAVVQSGQVPERAKPTKRPGKRGLPGERRARRSRPSL
jgi:predicted HicB family RNase H-like nuclease